MCNYNTYSPKIQENYTHKQFYIILPFISDNKIKYAHMAYTNHYLPIQKSRKITSNNSSASIRPVIRPK